MPLPHESPSLCLSVCTPARPAKGGIALHDQRTTDAPQRMQATVAPPMPAVAMGDGQAAFIRGAVSPGAPTTVFVPVVMQPQRQPQGLTSGQQLAMKVLGAMQVTIGALCILISSILVSQRATAVMDKAGAGIWCGVFFILPGAFALAAAATNKVGWMIATMVMSIFSTLMLWNVLAFASASVDDYSRCTQYYDFWDYSRCASIADRKGYTAADSLLIALSLIELVVAIWCAAICCKGVCCKGVCCRGGCCSCCCYDPYSSQSSPQVVHYANVASPGMSGEQRVIIMQHSTTYGAGALGVTATQHGFGGGQLLATQSATAYPQPGYGPPSYEQLSAGASVPPNYYASGGDTAASFATAQPAAAAAAAAGTSSQPADAEKRNLGADP